MFRTGVPLSEIVAEPVTVLTLLFCSEKKSPGNVHQSKKAKTVFELVNPEPVPAALVAVADPENAHCDVPLPGVPVTLTIRSADAMLIKNGAMQTNVAPAAIDLTVEFNAIPCLLVFSEFFLNGVSARLVLLSCRLTQRGVLACSTSTAEGGEGTKNAAEQRHHQNFMHRSALACCA